MEEEEEVTITVALGLEGQEVSMVEMVLMELNTVAVMETSLTSQPSA